MQTVVRCYFKTFGDFVTIYSTNLSTNGILIASNQAPRVGAQVRLEFKLRNDYPLITGEGEIAGVQPGGFVVRFVKLDDESEKFLNEVVKVKAAEVKLDPGAPLPTYESKIEHIEGGDAVNEFEDAEEIQEVEEFEEPETVEDVFAGIDEPTGTDVDFSSVQLNADAPAAAEEDPFADFDDSPAEPAAAAQEAVDDPFGGFDDAPADPAEFGTEETVAAGADGYAPADAATDTGSYEDTSYEDVPADDEYEGMEQTPANPQSLFEDMDDGHASAPFSMPEGEAPAIGESTAAFESKSRRALFIGVGAGVAALALAGAGWFFFLREPDMAVVQQPAVQPTTAAMTAPAPAPTTTTSAAPASTAVAAAPALETAPAQPVAAAPAQAEAAAAPTPTPAPAVATVPAAKPAPVPAKAQPAADMKRVVPAGGARRVTGVGANPDGALVIQGDGAFGKVKYFGMSDPNRIVVDIVGVTKGFKGNNLKGKGAISRIRPGAHDGKLRLVFDLTQDSGRMPAYEVVTTADRITVRVLGGAKTPLKTKK